MSTLGDPGSREVTSCYVTDLGQIDVFQQGHWSDSCTTHRWIPETFYFECNKVHQTARAWYFTTHLLSFLLYSKLSVVMSQWIMGTTNPCEVKRCGGYISFLSKTRCFSSVTLYLNAVVVVVAAALTRKPLKLCTYRFLGSSRIARKQYIFTMSWWRAQYSPKKNLLTSMASKNQIAVL